MVHNWVLNPTAGALHPHLQPTAPFAMQGRSQTQAHPGGAGTLPCRTAWRECLAHPQWAVDHLIPPSHIPLRRQTCEKQKPSLRFNAPCACCSLWRECCSQTPLCLCSHMHYSHLLRGPSLTSCTDTTSAYLYRLGGTVFHTRHLTHPSACSSLAAGDADWAPGHLRSQPQQPAPTPAARPSNSKCRAHSTSTPPPRAPHRAALRSSRPPW